MLVCNMFGESHKSEHVKQAIEEMLNACEIDKQWVHAILHDNVRNMKKAMDVMDCMLMDRMLHRIHTSAAC